MEIRGVLFDMDGVLVDSEEYINQAAITMFKEKGLVVKPEDFLPFVGAGEDRYLGGVAEKYNFPIDIEKDKARTYKIYEKIVKDELHPLKGVLAFIEKCKKRNLKLAVATSADKTKMEINLRESGIDPNNFQALINGNHVQNKKPDPEIYLLAAEKIDILPENCLVVEDAVNGVEAAKRAGAKCLALTTSFNKRELSDADWIAADLSDAPDESIEW